MLNESKNVVTGYLPDEKPTFGKTLLFAIQQVLVMFPATVTVALLTGFHISTTIFASGFSTLCFLFITKGKLPLYYGSSFSYIAAIIGITGAEYGVTAPDALLSQAQFGILCSGFVSILAGILVNFVGMKVIEKVLPPTVTGSIALIIGVSLMATAMDNATGFKMIGDVAVTDNNSWIAAIITLVATLLFSVYFKKGVLGQVPILLGMIVGYAAAIPLGLVDFSQVFAGQIIAVPHFTLPTPNIAAVAAIMPIALATIPESSAHLFQLDIYVNDLAKKKQKPRYEIADKLGANLIGDGIGDITSSLIGGPAGTNYGENLSTMAITKNFSIWVLGAAAIMSMILSFVSPLSNLINTIPGAVVNGACIFLFGVIGAQGIAIMVTSKIDMFDSRNLAIIATTLTIGIGGHFGFGGSGMIPFFGAKLPAIATASIMGILLNIVLSIGRKDENNQKFEQMN